LLLGQNFIHSLLLLHAANGLLIIDMVLVLLLGKSVRDALQA